MYRERASKKNNNDFSHFQYIYIIYVKWNKTNSDTQNTIREFQQKKKRKANVDILCSLPWGYAIWRKKSDISCLYKCIAANRLLRQEKISSFSIFYFFCSIHVGIQDVDKCTGV